MNNVDDRYEDVLYDLDRQYRELEMQVNGIMEAKEFVAAATNASSHTFRGLDPYSELKELRDCLDDFLLDFKYGIRNPALEGSIGAFEEYFSELICERVEFDLPEIKRV